MKTTRKYLSTQILTRLMPGKWMKTISKRHKRRNVPYCYAYVYFWVSCPLLLNARIFWWKYPYLLLVRDQEPLAELKSYSYIFNIEIWYSNNWRAVGVKGKKYCLCNTFLQATKIPYDRFGSVWEKVKKAHWIGWNGIMLKSVSKHEWVSTTSLKELSTESASNTKNTTQTRT